MRWSVLLFLAASRLATSADPTDCFDPWGKEQRRARVKLAEGTSCAPGTATTQRGFRIEYRDSRLTIGDEAGQWRIPAPGHFCDYLWTRDFDKNGRIDLLLTGATGGNGLAPYTYLFFVMIDANGQPRPWIIFGYGARDSDGPEDLVDLNGDGRIEVVARHFGGAELGQYNYWTTALYEPRNAFWRMVVGPFGPASYPVHSKFTFACHNLPAFFAPGKGPSLADRSNATLGEEATLISQIKPGRVGDEPPRAKGEVESVYYTRLHFKQSTRIELADGRLCGIPTGATLLHTRGGVVRSWRDQLIPHPDDGASKRLMEQARANRWPVRVAASLEKGYCFIQHLWVEQP